MVLSSCEDDVSNSYINTNTNSDTLRFKIRVDTIISTDTIIVGDTIKFKLYGYIGSNLCYSFSHFERYGPTPANNYKISVWGKYVPAPTCALAVAHLRGKEYRVIPQQQGIFILSIIQPDYSILKDSVIVR